MYVKDDNILKQLKQNLQSMAKVDVLVEEELKLLKDVKHKIALPSYENCGEVSKEFETKKNDLLSRASASSQSSHEFLTFFHTQLKELDTTLTLDHSDDISASQEERQDDDDDLVLTQQTVSYKCPITTTLFENPVKR